MSMTAEETKQFVTDLYAASGSGDWEKTAAMLTDDFVAIEADSLPMAGEYPGKDGLKNLFTKVMGIVDVSGLEIVETLVGGDYAITIVRMQFADPSLEPAELCERFQFRDGKCCEIKPYYFDPAQFNAACEAKARATAG